MPDQNDIPFSQYSIDLFAVFDRLFSGSLGAGGSGASGSGGGATGASGPLDALVAMFGTLFDFLSTAWNIWVVLSWLLSFLLIYGIVYAYIRANQLADEVKEILARDELIYAELYRGQQQNNRWQQVMSHLETENPNDWKLAIIEADIILGEVLNEKGYAGTSIGDQLKSVSPTSLRTLDDAWEAHKVRNQVAHGGADFILTKRLARDTIARYQRVFTEFDVVI
jgi:hypothetical protein